MRRHDNHMLHCYATSIDACVTWRGGTDEWESLQAALRRAQVIGSPWFRVDLSPPPIICSSPYRPIGLFEGLLLVGNW